MYNKRKVYKSMVRKEPEFCSPHVLLCCGKVWDIRDNKWGCVVLRQTRQDFTAPNFSLYTLPAEPNRRSFSATTAFIASIS